jgi:hypothetical protein
MLSASTLPVKVDPPPIRRSSYRANRLRSGMYGSESPSGRFPSYNQSGGMEAALRLSVSNSFGNQASQTAPDNDCEFLLYPQFVGRCEAAQKRRLSPSCNASSHQDALQKSRGQTRGPTSAEQTQSSELQHRQKPTGKQAQLLFGFSVAVGGCRCEKAAPLRAIF